MSNPKIFKPSADVMIVGEGGTIIVQAGGKIVVEDGGAIEGPQIAGGEAELLPVAEPQPPIDNLPKQTTVAETAAKVNTILDALRAAGIIAKPLAQPPVNPPEANGE